MRDTRPIEIPPGRHNVPPGLGAVRPGINGPAVGPSRPGTVVAGAVLTYIGAGLVIALGILLLAVAAMAEYVENELGTSALSNLPVAIDEIQLALLALGGVVVLIGVALIVLAVHAQRGSDVARAAVTGIGAFVVLLSIVDVVAGGYGSIVTVVYIGTAVLLFWVGGANGWYRRRDESY